jgi:peptidoglycan/LPS O-acetylase OafA/YrhL
MWILSVISIVGNTWAFVAGYWNDQLSLEYNALFTATYRFSWALPIAWWIYALDSGSGEKFNEILSHRFWIPLGKLGFCLYLVHPVFQYALLSSQTSPITFGMLEVVRSPLVPDHEANSNSLTFTG